LKEAQKNFEEHRTSLRFYHIKICWVNYALSSGEVFNNDYFEMVREEITSGIRNNRALKNKTFVQAYFHLVQEIEAEFAESGLIVENSFGVVGQAWETPDLETVILDSEKKERLLEVAEMMEAYPMLGSKILTVGKLFTIRNKCPINEQALYQ